MSFFNLESNSAGFILSLVSVFRMADSIPFVISPFIFSLGFSISTMIDITIGQYLSSLYENTLQRAALSNRTVGELRYSIFAVKLSQKVPLKNLRIKKELIHPNKTTCTVYEYLLFLVTANISAKIVQWSTLICSQREI